MQDSGTARFASRAPLHQWQLSGLPAAACLCQRAPATLLAVAELEAALAARDTQLAAAQEAQRSSMALLSTRGRSTVGEVCGGRLNAWHLKVVGVQWWCLLSVLGP